MKLRLLDPSPFRNDYLSKMYFLPMADYATRQKIDLLHIDNLDKVRNCTVLTICDYLTPEIVARLKQNGCKIVGFNVIDSSYLSQSIRSGEALEHISLIFSLTGIQRVNTGHEFTIDQDFNVILEPREFLPPDQWKRFDNMRREGRLRSLPYVNWERQTHVVPRAFNERSQKVLIRGGLHSRRFILALFLLRAGRLDVNSGFFSSPYFAHDMNPQFRYCDDCRNLYNAWQGRFMYGIDCKKLAFDRCNSPAFKDGNWDVSNLGLWNNRCPRSFFWLTEQFEKKHGPVDMAQVETMLNAKWLTQKQHSEMLARITFTADLKWLFSIYAAQRFWDAGAVGCINLLPKRTVFQDFFPPMLPDEHYVTFWEDFRNIEQEASITHAKYLHIANAVLDLFNLWMRPSDYAISTNLLQHIFNLIEEKTT